MDAVDDGERAGGTSAEALAAVERIMNLEGMTRDCLARLDDLERVVGLEQTKLDLERDAEERHAGSSAPLADAPSGRSSVADIDAQIAAVKAEALERQKRNTEAKARFAEAKGSIERGEAHIANIELMSVQTPEGQAALQ